MATKKDLTKEEKIKREFSRLKRIFKDLDKNKLQTVESLIKNAAFMAVSLEELQEIINEEGYTVEYQNGANQSGTKQSDAVKTHIAMTKITPLLSNSFAILYRRRRKRKAVYRRYGTNKNALFKLHLRVLRRHFFRKYNRRQVGSPSV